VTTHFLSSSLLLAVALLLEPKQLRSIATRARLVEAAAASLVELGYRGASTAVMAERAGVSQGALFKHFPQKADLLSACLEKILADFRVEFRTEIGSRLDARTVPLEARLAPAIALLWRIFRRPGMQAVFELYVAARTDVRLGERFAAILAAHREGILDEARAIFPELADRADDFAGAVDAVVYAMQGVALGLFVPGEADDKAHLAFFQRLAQHEMALALTGRA
jgi:AcrR family transcriptional regulator